MNSSRPTLPPSYTPPEVAKSFRVAVQVVRQWITSGKLRAMNIAASGRPKYRITAESLRLFTEKMERDSQALLAPESRPRGRPPKRMAGVKNHIRG